MINVSSNFGFGEIPQPVDKETWYLGGDLINAHGYTGRIILVHSTASSKIEYLASVTNLPAGYTLRFTEQSKDEAIAKFWRIIELHLSAKKYEHYQEMLRNLPTVAILAIINGGNWADEFDHDGGINYYSSSYTKGMTFWESEKQYLRHSVEDGILRYGLYIVYPCGDREWSEDADDYCDVSDANYPLWAEEKLANLNAESEKSIKEYESWAEENGKDPLDHYPDLAADPNDRLAMSIAIWERNQQMTSLLKLDPQYLEKLQKRFPPGFVSNRRFTFKGNLLTYWYRVKYHCNYPMIFNIDFNSPSPTAHFICENCGQVLEAKFHDEYSHWGLQKNG